MITPGCDGQGTGDDWLSYFWVRGMVGRHDVTLVTTFERGEAPVSEQFPGLRVIEWPNLKLFRKFEHFNNSVKPHYVPFYLKARRWTRKALAAGERFDLAHQVAPGALRYPSPVAGLSIPYIFGPIGGSLETPPEFAKEEGTTPWYVGLRALDRFRLRWDPILRATFEGASCVVGAAPYVKSILNGVSLRRIVIMNGAGIESVPDPIDRSDRTGQVRLLFVGRLVRTKGVREAIRAMKGLVDLPVVLDIVGDGYDQDVCKSLASEIGVSQRVIFHGASPTIASTNSFALPISSYIRATAKPAAS
jgi:glycosyltransferase involved in cell wall biosynthesis